MNTNSNLADVFVERSFQSPIRTSDDHLILEETVACLNLYSVRFVESFLSENRHRMICHFVAPDAESVRQAMPGAELNADSIWAGKIHDEPGNNTGNVIVETMRDSSIDTRSQSLTHDAVHRALRATGLRLSRTFTSLDQMRTVSLFAVPDRTAVESVVSTLQQPSNAIWFCQHRTALRRIA
jgi:hypothetical protein